MLPPELSNLVPQGMLHWSSFPSDHAAMFVALAVGLLSVSRGFGAFALAHAVVDIDTMHTGSLCQVPSGISAVPSKGCER